jgi:predicted ABC-type ATPase
MNIVPAERPRMIIVAGPNGSGKTTLTEAIRHHQWFNGCEYINPDDIAKELGDWNDPIKVEKAAIRATEKREACIKEGRSLAFETVFSAPDKVDFVRRGIEAGFFVRLFFIGTYNAHINAARVARRMLEGGHEVPIRKIIDRWSRSISNCAAVARGVDRLYLYDNSVDGREYQIILRAKNGVIERWYLDVNENEPQWASPIIDELEDPS